MTAATAATTKPAGDSKSAPLEFFGRVEVVLVAAIDLVPDAEDSELLPEAEEEGFAAGETTGVEPGVRVPAGGVVAVSFSRAAASE